MVSPSNPEFLSFFYRQNNKDCRKTDLKYSKMGLVRHVSSDVADWSVINNALGETDVSFLTD